MHSVISCVDGAILARFRVNVNTLLQRAVAACVLYNMPQ